MTQFPPVSTVIIRRLQMRIPLPVVITSLTFLPHLLMSTHIPARPASRVSQFRPSPSLSSLSNLTNLLSRHQRKRNRILMAVHRLTMQRNLIPRKQEGQREMIMVNRMHRHTDNRVRHHNRNNRHHNNQWVAAALVAVVVDLEVCRDSSRQQEEEEGGEETQCSNNSNK